MTTNREVGSVLAAFEKGLGAIRSLHLARLEAVTSTSAGIRADGTATLLLPAGAIGAQPGRSTAGRVPGKPRGLNPGR